MSAATVPGIEEFVFVDTAFGGVNRRNNVRRLDEVRLNGLSDCYVSHNRARGELLTWLGEHRNENGNPTVAGFDGPTWADNLHLDYDNEADPGQALIWLRQGLDWFEAHGVELRALRVYFSGYKGFGVEVPHTLFGGFAPAVDFHKRLGRAAKRILGTIPYDTSVYDKIRLWRLENSRHSKSRLYKIRLTVAEARTLTIDQIRALAATPRDIGAVPELAPIPDDEWLPVPKLAEIWDATASPDEDERVDATERRPPTNEARDRLTEATIAASWPHGGRNAVEGESGNATVSRHSQYLMPIIGFLATRTSAEHAGEIVAAAAEEAGDRTFLNGRDWCGEIKRIADSTAARMNPGSDERVKGLPSLAKEFPGLADVLEALWPAPRILFTEDETGTTPTPARADGVPWPEPLAEEAYHGLLGDAVRAIAPTTEADPAALFAHLIVGTGVLLGRHTRAMVGNAPHPPKINAVVVGKTSQGRKGTSQRASEGVLVPADPTFAGRITEGLSSGEGLIWQCRDPIYKWEKARGGEAEEVLVDPGVMDKRLLVVESEFASVLRVAQRDGNTLTAIIRRAWDRDDLRSLTKNNPASATGAHIGIVGHVSRDEFLRYLDRSELASGFANRFLFFAVKRSRLLPDGETLSDDVLAPFAARLRVALDWAGESRILQRDAEARAVWHEVYPSLTAERAGMFGGATSRAEARVLRLSALYAVLDCSAWIRAEHLAAALAIWRYCEQSARWVFGDAIGDPTADTILGALRRVDELDREDIVNLFGRHANRDRVDRALGLLVAAGLAAPRRESTGGRPREVWRAT